MHFSEEVNHQNINRYSALISRQTGACLFGTNLISKHVSIFVICFTPIKKWMKIQLKTNCKNKQKKPLYQLTIPTSPTGYSLPVSHFSSSHFDHRSVDNNSICYNSNPHSCQGHPLASDMERGCAGSRNPDKLSRAYEDFSLASPPRLAINLILLQTGGTNQTDNKLRGCHQQLSHLHSHPNTNDSLFVVCKVPGFDWGFEIGLERRALCGSAKNSRHLPPWIQKPAAK